LAIICGTSEASKVGVALGVDDVLAFGKAVVGQSLLEAGDRGGQLRMFAEIGDADLDRVRDGGAEADSQRTSDKQARQQARLQVFHHYLPV
jgi:hypothetical protein